MTRRQLVTLTIIVECGLVVAAVLGAWLFRLPMKNWLNWRPVDVLWGLAAGVVLLGLLWLSRQIPVRSLRDLKTLVDDRVAPLFRDCTWRDFLLISLLAGLGEELFFRGFLQAWITRDLAGGTSSPEAPWIALVIVSILFGLAHCISREYTFFATLLGLLLGALALATNNLLAPIIAHAAYDFAALLWLTRRDGQPRGGAL